jgi:transposase
MQIRPIGIDLGKTNFHLVALGLAGKVLVKKKFTQKRLTGVHSEPADLA